MYVGACFLQAFLSLRRFLPPPFPRYLSRALEATCKLDIVLSRIGKGFHICPQKRSTHPTPQHANNGRIDCCTAVGCTLQDTERLFGMAANHMITVKGLILSSDQRLELYSLFKQATEGDCEEPKPGLIDLVGRAKW